MKKERMWISRLRRRKYSIVALFRKEREREIYTNILGAYKDANEMRLSISV